MSNPHWAKSIDAIMKLVRDMEPDIQIECCIQRRLEEAYAQGFADADRNPRQPESMGR